MSVNTTPIFSAAGQISWPTTVLTAANTSYDCSTGTSASVITGTASGSFIQRLRFKASGSTNPTVARIFINNGGSSTNAANNILFDEVTLAATTASPLSATTVYELPMNLALPAGYQILATLAVSQNTTGGWYVSAIGGSYVPQ